MAVNAALAIELYLKSFLALNIVKEESSNMGFSTEYGHAFMKLLSQLDTDDKNLLFIELNKINSEIDWEVLFEKYDSTFVKVRYWYESGNGVVINPGIVDLAINLGEAVLRAGRGKHA